MKTFDIFGLGSAFIDVLVMVKDTDQLEFPVQKGIMSIVDEKGLQDVLKKISSLNPQTIPGGSVANTCAGVVRLGGKAVFCGLVGKDENGRLFEEKMQAEGVEVRLSKDEEDGLTATAVTLITPDAERSFIDHFGTALKTHKDHVIEADIAASKIAQFEGYMLEGEVTRAAAHHAMGLAKKHSTLVSLDVSDAGVIRRITDIIKDTIKKYVDILFLNETEAEALIGKKHDDAEAMDEIARLAGIVVVKIGKAGSIIRHGNEEVHIKGIKAEAIDTTGAGDMYAAGFLFGIAQGYTLKQAGNIASMAAAKVVEKMGARLGSDLKDEVATILSA